MDNPWGATDDNKRQDDAWAQPKGFGAAHDDHEADLSATTSWPTPQWNNDEEDHGSSLWGTAALDDGGWGTSTYEGIDLGSSGLGSSVLAPHPPSPPPFANGFASELPPSEDEIGETITTPHEGVLHLQPSADSYASHPPSPIQPVSFSDPSPFAESSPFAEPTAFGESSPFAVSSSFPSSDPTAFEPLPDDDGFRARPDSPDGFGTFELGSAPVHADEPVWASAADTHSATVGASPWGEDAWAPAAEEQESQPADEWEAAKLEKKKRDARVVSIRHFCNVLSLTYCSALDCLG
jgi:hypothetical protein